MTDLDLALERLASGELVAIPTETVYGLAADARNADAIAKIFALKGRPADHPVIVHIAGSQQLSDWAVDIPAAAYALAEAFWPGPLTLILPRHPDVPLAVTGGQDTVGVRAPDHPLTTELLTRFKGGLAAPSANRFGHVSPTTAQHVRDEFGAQCPLVLDGGACSVGVESTIVSLIGDTPKLLRPGGVPRTAIEAVLGQELEHHVHAATAKVRVSGLLDSHYAPRTLLISGCDDAIHAAASAAQSCGERVMVLTQASHHSLPTTVLPGSPDAYARQLYATLRALDAGGFDALYLVLPPQTPEWLAVNDRLRRAAHKRL
ncbi:L-threonylcarbamoyladenylate synthase [Chitinibacteraceae bacterium HSL-7]